VEPLENKIVAIALEKSTGETILVIQYFGLHKLTILCAYFPETEDITFGRLASADPLSRLDKLFAYRLRYVPCVGSDMQLQSSECAQQCSVGPAPPSVPRSMFDH